MINIDYGFTSPYPVIHFDRNLNILHQNKSALEDLVFTSAFDWALAQEEWTEKIGNCIEISHPVQYETQAGGRTYSVVLLPVLGAEEVIAYFFRISPKRWAEETLVQFRNIFQTAASELEHVYFILDSIGNILYADQECEKFTSREVSEFSGKHFSECFFLSPVRDCIVDLLEQEDLVKTGSRQFQLQKNSVLKYYRMSRFTRYNETGEVMKYIFALLDITPWQEYEKSLLNDVDDLEDRLVLREKQLEEVREKLYHSKRLADIGTLAATVAHELRNPLATIKAALFNLNRKNKQDELIRHFDVIDKKVSESEQIINNLLFYSRMKHANKQVIEPWKIIKEAVLTCSKLQQEESDVEFIQDLEVIRGVEISADPLQLAEVIRNILDNAVASFNGGTGKVKVFSRLEGNEIILEVKDDGGGIPEEYQNKLFEPFFTTKAKGTGLGLSVCRQIAELHDWSLNIESIEEQGTEVTILIPMDRMADE